MTPRAEQLVLDYLSQVGQVTYGYLTARRRATYLAELRSRIDEACGDSTDPNEVRRTLARFGAPEELVARECAEDTEGTDRDGSSDGATQKNGATQENSAVPRHAHREPPPWRGGPNRGVFGGVRGTGVGATGDDAPRGAVMGVARAARAYPPEIFTILVYLVSGLIGQVTLVWAIGAVLVVLSEVWNRRDKAVAVGLPLAATLVGMALWRGEAHYIDQIILSSLVENGVIGLRLASLGCAVYLLVRISRLARRNLAP